MNIIVPMAGMGKRMRPHTLTVPKPLIQLAGKSIVQRLVEDIVAVCDEPIEEIGFIIGHFGEAVEQELLSIAQGLNAKGRIYYQEEALGTAHAILCAEASLQGKTIVAFADTLFKADFKISDEQDGVLWVKQIDDPSAFGVVELNAAGQIVDFVEKPETFVSDLAMIGVYYFKDGENLKAELQYLIDNKVIKSGEYQLPDALRNMTNKGLRFVPGKVGEWLDCGNKDATVHSNQRVLEHIGHSVESSFEDFKNVEIVPPCYIAEGVVLKNCKIGPHVSLGRACEIEDAVISNSILAEEVKVTNAQLSNSMLGSHSTFEGRGTDLASDVSISAYSSVKL
ncbi:MAG TPA: nucleotidyltransferase [Flavobacteriales bacterium]|mgnify:FL=1|jgi:glucose-1-phosphate thymidylyltransferase|nr:sugar phosphate nucleotidyltransferase [Salibacteraceae bacterium]HAS36619.1 nucleotidyltransferase [Flavobacteriales bacterium]